MASLPYTHASLLTSQSVHRCIPIIAHTLVWSAQGGGSRTDATDIICPMYARIDECVSFANIPTEHRPVIQCEYAHAMGNSNGNYKVCNPVA